MRLLDRMTRELPPETTAVEDVVAALLRHCREHVALVRALYLDSKQRSRLQQVTADALWEASSARGSGG